MLLARGAGAPAGRSSSSLDSARGNSPNLSSAAGGARAPAPAPTKAAVETSDVQVGWLWSAAVWLEPHAAELPRFATLAPASQPPFQPTPLPTHASDTHSSNHNRWSIRPSNIWASPSSPPSPSSSSGAPRHLPLSFPALELPRWRGCPAPPAADPRRRSHLPLSSSAHPAMPPAPPRSVRNSRNESALAMSDLTLQYWFGGPVDGAPLFAETNPAQFFAVQCEWATTGERRNDRLLGGQRLRAGLQQSCSTSTRSQLLASRPTATTAARRLRQREPERAAGPGGRPLSRVPHQHELDPRGGAAAALWRQRRSRAVPGEVSAAAAVLLLGRTAAGLLPCHQQTAALAGLKRRLLPCPSFLLSHLQTLPFPILTQGRRRHGPAGDPHHPAGCRAAQLDAGTSRAVTAACLTRQQLAPVCPSPRQPTPRTLPSTPSSSPAAGLLVPGHAPAAGGHQLDNHPPPGAAQPPHPNLPQRSVAALALLLMHAVASAALLVSTPPAARLPASDRKRPRSNLPHHPAGTLVWGTSPGADGNDSAAEGATAPATESGMPAGITCEPGANGQGQNCG